MAHVHAKFSVKVATLAQRHHPALRFTGRVLALVGLTLAVGVVNGAFSPIRFKAGTGVMPTFMSLWNMGGAGAVPALSCWLLRDGAVQPVPQAAVAAAMV